jgi:hypothetical protein
MKERPIIFQTKMVKAILEGRKTHTRRVVGKGRWHNRFIVSDSPVKYEIASTHDCPYGKAGDLLWVRETWAPLGDYPKCNYSFMYKADTELSYSKWKLSIHMPKDAARIWLQVEDVRVERLHDITKDDAIAEGIRDGDPMPVIQFKNLWQSINGPESWEQNPFVWVIKFKVLSTTGKPEGGQS